jgi:hypothetical protein
MNENFIVMKEMRDDGSLLMSFKLILNQFFPGCCGIIEIAFICPLVISWKLRGRTKE